MIAPMRGFGIFELYRQMAEEQTLRETALIAGPDPRLRRENAILTRLLNAVLESFAPGPRLD